MIQMNQQWVYLFEFGVVFCVMFSVDFVLLSTDFVLLSLLPFHSLPSFRTAACLSAVPRSRYLPFL